MGTSTGSSERVGTHQMANQAANQDTNRRWKHRPEGSNWGDFGPDDQTGRLNLITAEKVRQGVAEVREGRTFCLSLPLDYPGGNVLNPRRHPPALRPTVRNGRPNMNYRLFVDNEAQTDVISDDLAVLHLQYSTQWDSLAHVGSLFDADGDGVPDLFFYNGWRAGDEMVGPRDGRDAGRPEQLSCWSSARTRAGRERCTLPSGGVRSALLGALGDDLDLHEPAGDRQAADLERRA